jgi:hypothetical protein
VASPVASLASFRAFCRLYVVPGDTHSFGAGSILEIGIPATDNLGADIPAVAMTVAGTAVVYKVGNKMAANTRDKKPGQRLAVLA